MNIGLLTAILGGLGAMLGWGTSDLFAKKTVDKIGDTASLFWVQTLGVVPLLVYVLASGTGSFNFADLPQLFVYAVLDASGYLFFYRALKAGKVSIISPISASYAAFAVIISALVFKESLSFRAISLLGLIFIGILLVTLDFKQLRAETKNLKNIFAGVPEVLLTVICWSIWFPFWDHYVASRNWSVSLLGLRIIMSLFILLFIKIKGITTTVKNSKIWLWIIIIALLDVGAYFALTWGYHVSSFTSLISVLSAGYSLPTLILARIFLKEKLQPSQWLGALTIIAGLILISL